MIYKYDKAIYQKFKEIFDRTIYAPTNKFYERYLLSQDNKENVKLPALSIWRTSYEFDTYGARTQLNVANLKYHKNFKYATELKTVPLILNYQLDIWASSDIERDDLLTEIMYFLTLYPAIHIEYDNRHYCFAIQIENPDDTTDIANFETDGDLFRVTIPLRVVDARLFYAKDVPVCHYLDLSLYVDDKLEEKIHVGIKPPPHHGGVDAKIKDGDINVPNNIDDQLSN